MNNPVSKKINEIIYIFIQIIDLKLQGIKVWQFHTRNEWKIWKMISNLTYRSVQYYEIVQDGMNVKNKEKE